MDCIHCRGKGSNFSKDGPCIEHCYECAGTGIDPDTETLRSVMFSRMRSFLESWTTLDGKDLDSALEKVIEIAFDTCKITEKERDKDWRDEC